MTGFVFHLGCPNCGTAPEPRAMSRPHDGGLRTTGVVACPHCRHEWLVEVQLSRFHDRQIGLPA